MKTIVDLAKRIFNGESKEVGDYCLLPSSFGEQWLGSRAGDDPIIEKYGATHFDVHWEEEGKTVLVNLYKGNTWGCYTTIEKVHSEIVSLQE